MESGVKEPCVPLFPGVWPSKGRDQARGKNESHGGCNRHKTSPCSLSPERRPQHLEKRSAGQPDSLRESYAAVREDSLYIHRSTDEGNDFRRKPCICNIGTPDRRKPAQQQISQRAAVTSAHTIYTPPRKERKNSHQIHREKDPCRREPVCSKLGWG